MTKIRCCELGDRGGDLGGIVGATGGMMVVTPRTGLCPGSLASSLDSWLHRGLVCEWRKD